MDLKKTSLFGEAALPSQSRGVLGEEQWFALLYPQRDVLERAADEFTAARVGPII